MRNSETWNTKRLTEMAEETFFWLFCKMMLILQTTLDGLLSWSEGCSCHEDLIDPEKSDWHDQQAFLHELREAAV